MKRFPVRIIIRTALLLVLWASLDLRGAGAGQAGEKREIIEPGINASLKVMNGTPWVMPPEVEALFPKDAVWNEIVWRILTENLLTNSTCRMKTKHKVSFTGGIHKGVCLETIRNINLYAGMYDFGCSVITPHKLHPNKSRFDKIEWNSLDPKDNVAKIKEYFNFSESAGYKKHSWAQVGPIIKQMLTQKDGILLQFAMVDIFGNGTYYRVYRIAFPKDKSCAPDGSLCRWWHMFIVDDYVIKNDFNKSFTNTEAEFYYYSDKLYIGMPYGVYQIYLGSDRSHEGFGFSNVCLFE